MTGGREWAGYLNADFDVWDIVLVEHHVVTLLIEPLRSVAPKKAPYLVQHRLPHSREIRPRRRRRYYRCRRWIDGLHGHFNAHGAEPTPHFSGLAGRERRDVRSLGALTDKSLKTSYCMILT